MSTHKPRTKAEAHEEATNQDLRDQYTCGQQIDLVIIDSPEQNNGREAFARHDDVSVFIYPGRSNLTAGTHIKARVSEIGERHLKAVTLFVLD
jgi:hypothetical protein